MFNKHTNDFRYHPAITGAIFIALILYWITLYLEHPLDTDIGWLLQCLERFLAGGTYTQNFYETNPPLSFLIYLPAYPFYAYFGLDPQLAVVICFALYIALASLILFKMLSTNHIPVTTSFLIAQTCAMGISFGSKDHLVFIFLPVLCMAQYLITTNQKPNRILCTAAILMGGTAIALKPHYLIIPALFLLYRLYVMKSVIKCLKSPDVIGLLLYGTGYLLFIQIFTPEFWDILPQITSLYSLEQPFPPLMRVFYLAFAAAAILCTFFTEDKNLKAAIYALAGLSLLCLVPYLIQNKGWHYHALPLLGFAMTALFLGLYGASRSLIKSADIRLWIAAAFIALLSLNFTTGGKKQFMTQGQFLAQPAINAVDELAWNRTYAIIDFKAPLGALPYMTDLKNGTRFGQLWPLYGLKQKHEAAKTEEERTEIKSQMLTFINLIADDIEYHQPSALLIPQYIDLATKEPSKNFYTFLIKNENLKKTMQNYVFEDTLSIDTSFSANNTNPDKIVEYDIFVLKKDHDL